MWRIVPVNILTGRPVMTEIECSDWSWSVAVNRSTEGSFTIQARELGLDRDAVRLLRKEWSTVFVVEWVDDDGGRFPLFAGIVVGSDWDPVSGVMTVETVTVDAVLSRRFLSGLGARNTKRWRYAGRTHSSAVSSLINLGGGSIDETRSNPRQMLPMGAWYNDAREVEITPRTYPQQRDPAWSIIEQLAGEIDHYMIAFLPIWGRLWQGPRPAWIEDDGLVWLAAFGTDIEPWPPGTASMVVDSHAGSVPRLADFRVRRDGRKMASGVLLLGEGTGEAQPAAIANRNTVSGVPTDMVDLDVVVSAPKVGDPSELRAAAQAALRERRAATVQYSAAARVGADSHPIDFSLGKKLTIDRPADEYDDGGATVLRVIGLSGGPGLELGIELQEARDG